MMKGVRTVNPRRLILLAVVLILASLVLVFWARDVIREVFVLPLSYLWWSVSTILIVIPQLYQWLAVVTLAVLIAFRALAGRPKKTAPAPPQMAELNYQQSYSRGRLSFWATRVDLLQAGTSAYYRGTFHGSLGRLLIELLAHRYRLSVSEVEARLREDPHSEAAEPLGRSVPPEIREYALFSLQRGEMRIIRRRERWLRPLQEMLQGWLHLLPGYTARSAQQQMGRPIDPRVLRVLEYMQEELEVTHDNSGY